MNRKHYQLIAGSINDSLPDMDSREGEAVRDLVNHLCRALQADNPAFDRDKFLEACGLGGA